MNIDRAIALIQELHAGQFDWSGGPYWEHPVAVMNRLPAGSPDDRKLIALFHDAVEDSYGRILLALGFEGMVPEKLTHEVANLCYGWLIDQGVSRHAVAGIRLVTRIPGEFTYSEMIQHLVDSCHVDAMMVKLSDNRENSSTDRYAKLSETDLGRAMSMRPRYLKSIETISAKLVELGEVPF